MSLEIPPSEGRDREVAETVRRGKRLARAAARAFLLFVLVVVVLAAAVPLQRAWAHWLMEVYP
jgi:hypothetical protein